MNTTPPSHRQTGFGLLEAIVALALLAGAGMALFAWINTNLALAHRLQQTEAMTQATTLGTAWAQALHLADHPRGEVTLDAGVFIRWDSRPLTPPTPVVPLPGGIRTPFEVALYAVTVAVHHPELPQAHRFTLQRLAIWREPVETWLDAPTF
ncbi:type IV pilus modification PilV family protein [Ectothiorhodospira lacustris]|uniref:type IV pilus modification PilV family protein n=1 Tax=Ectothiorhodospira lacustris TaxID=2899127 RepID=UPI001EE7E353|nr:hypothetical protein [Ectothiorhodospira lacustris]MCG5500815.1 hypothetical protein [Ectothiorhodospira lacustris]